jgi:uncharacterized membrane protein YfcA
LSLAVDASPWLIVGCGLGLFGGGLVKGAIGIGLPLVAAPALATLLGVKQAVAVLSLPVLVANVWQAWYGGHYALVLRRFWRLVIAMAIGIAAATRLLATLDANLLFLLLGVVVIAYPLTVLLRFELNLDARDERWASPLAGAIAGMLSGISYFFGPPLAIYFSALKLDKDLFVAAIALIGLIAAVLTAILLASHALLDAATLRMSLLAVIPTLAGTLVGTWIRSRIDEALFRKTVAIALLVIGANLVRKALS